MLHHSASDGTHLALCRLSVLAVLSESCTLARPSLDADFKLKHLAYSYKFGRRVCTVPVGSTGLTSQRRAKVLPNCLPSLGPELPMLSTCHVLWLRKCVADLEARRAACGLGWEV